MTATPSVNDGDPLSVNDGGPLSVNNGGPLSVNDGGPLSVNDGGPLSVNDGDPLSVNNDGPLHYHLNSFFVVKHRVKVIVNVDIIVSLSSYNIFTLENNIYNSFDMMTLFLTDISNAHATQL